MICTRRKGCRPKRSLLHTETGFGISAHKSSWWIINDSHYVWVMELNISLDRKWNAWENDTETLLFQYFSPCSCCKTRCRLSGNIYWASTRPLNNNNLKKICTTCSTWILSSMNYFHIHWVTGTAVSTLKPAVLPYDLLSLLCYRYSPNKPERRRREADCAELELNE